MNIKVSYKGIVMEFDSPPSSEEIIERYTILNNMNDYDMNAAKDNFSEISESQKSLWLASQIGNQPNVNLISFGIHFKGNLIVEYFKEAIQKVIEGQPTLKSSFYLDEDGYVKQLLNSKLEIHIKEIDLSKQLSNNYDNSINNYLRQQCDKPFNLRTDLLLRVSLLKFSDSYYLGLFTAHHIIFDGASVGIFVKQFSQYYMDLCLNNKIIPISTAGYADYVKKERNEFKNNDLDELDNFWLENYAGVSLSLDLHNVKKNKDIGFDCSSEILHLDNEFTKLLRQMSTQLGVSPFITLLTALNILLYRYTSQEEIIVGTPISTRSKEFKDVIGCFINMLALKPSLWGDPSIKELLLRVKHFVSSTFQRSNYPFSRLVELLKPQRTNHHPIFQVVLSYQKNPFSKLDIPELSLESFNFSDQASPYDLLLEVVDNSDTIDIRFQYRNELYNEDSIKNMISHYRLILQALLEDTTQSISDINLLSSEEEKKILTLFNNTVEAPQALTIIELFEKSVEKNPDLIAIEQCGSSLTYKELNQKSNQLARIIRNKGIQPNDVVGIMVSRSIDMIVSILAILKSGGAYLPIDPQYPKKRIEYILNNSNTKLILTEGNMENDLKAYKEILVIEKQNLQKEDNSNIRRINEPKDLAYLIYTSGSTGNPKGVMVEHSSILNFFCGIYDAIDFKDCKKTLSVTTISFDIHVLEILFPLVNGMSIVVANETEQFDMNLLAKLILDNSIEVIQLTPSRMRHLLSVENITAYLEKLKIMLVGGEVLSSDLLSLIKSSFNGMIFNMYGPTETTVWSCVADLTHTNEVTIGRPIANTQIIITNNDGIIQPIGIPGEICISGKGTARGYYNDPKLTEEKFILNNAITTERIYRTGDVGRYLWNGNIQYINRLDNQVKIRSYRIELGEIENVLSQHNAVKQCKVIVEKNEDGEDILIAFIIVNLSYIRTVMLDNFAVSELSNYLNDFLPYYMIPYKFIVLEYFPETPNGKIDVNKFPRINEIETDQQLQYVPPRNLDEQSVASAFEEILAIKMIGVYDNFFSLGGDSMKAIQLIAKLIEDGYEVEVKDLFKNQTVQSLSKCIKKSVSPFRDEVSMTSAQEELLKYMTD
ncbi:non-ribosomal peptide synthetase [Paenibacillus sp. T2-29]|uniref:non-ribosomal peptide synthetase n=1 Tax=Paenibacillus TaxID=44249 RepID=UPI0039BCEF49